MSHSSSIASAADYPSIANAVGAPWYEDLSPALLDECLEAGVSIVGCTAAEIWDDTLEAMENLQQVKTVVRSHGRAYVVDRDGATQTPENAGKVGVVLGLQNPKPLSDSLHILEAFIDMGLRCCSLAFRHNSYYGMGFASEIDTGLSDLGREAVRTMNRRGVVIDLSHSGDRTAMDAIETSEDPVIFSHSTARAIVLAKGLKPAQGVTHNLVKRAAPDELIKAAAARGGVICPDARTATVSDFIDQVDYLVDLVGPDHVGVAAQDDWHRSEKDVRRIQPYLPGYDSGRQFGSDYRIHRLGGQLGPKLLYAKELCAEFYQRGYSPHDVAKLFSANLLRVFRQVLP